jgi:hypothetical protein
MNTDVWQLVIAFLTPREARHLLGVVKGLKMSMCKQPSLKDVYRSRRVIGFRATPGADPLLCAGTRAIQDHYPRHMIVGLKLNTVMMIDWIHPGSDEVRTTATGVLVRFVQDVVLFNYTFFVHGS